LELDCGTGTLCTQRRGGKAKPDATEKGDQPEKKSIMGRGNWPLFPCGKSFLKSG